MARLRSIRHLRRFAQVGAHRRALLVEVVVWLLAARLALLFIPFPRLPRRLGTFVPPAQARAVQAKWAPGGEAARLAEEIGRGVTRAARSVPFKAVCLPQAMAARVPHFGAAQGTDKPLDAHAWLDAAGVQLTDYPVAKGFAEIACFV